MSVRICNELKKTSSTLTGGRLQEEDLIFIGVELEDNFYEAQFKLAWNSFFLALTVKDGVERQLWHLALTWQFHGFL